MTLSKRWRVLISCFILFNAVAILNSSSKPLAQQTITERFFSPYLTWTRLNQRWLLFTPEPRRFAKRYHVQIQFKNGEFKTWRRPYPPNWDFFERHMAYQFQKWDLAADYLDENKFLQRDLAHYMAKQFSTELNPAIKVTLFRETAMWPEPNPEGYVRSPEDHLPWQEYTVFNYDVLRDTFL